MCAAPLAGSAHRRDIEIRNQQILLKGLAPRHHFAGLIHDHAAAVENQLILPAHHVGVGDQHTILPRAGGQYLVAQAALADMERRGVDVHDNFSPCRSLRPCRPFGKPDVLANVHADGRAIQHQQRQTRPGTKIPALIKDAIIRQQPLAIVGDKPALTQHRGRIVEVMSTGREKAFSSDGGTPVASRETYPTTTTIPCASAATAFNARCVSSMKRGLNNKSSGGYPVMANSGNATMSAFARRASLIRS